jgi:hypothetical protein
MPPEYEGGTAFIFEMEPTPIITHDWQATIQGTQLTLIVEVKNSGTAVARLLTVYGAFDAGDNAVWNPVESEPFNLIIGASTTIQIELEVPPGKHTRLIIGVMGTEGYLLDQTYSEWLDT